MLVREPTPLARAGAWVVGISGGVAVFLLIFVTWGRWGGFFEKHAEQEGPVPKPGVETTVQLIGALKTGDELMVDGGVYRIDDDARGVTCYVITRTAHTSGSGIDCMWKLP